MNGQQLFLEFGHIASAPNGVDQLRQVVMGLALAGQLITDNESLPGNFEVQVAAAREKYFDDLGRRVKPLLYGEPLIKEFRIPAGWRWIRVGEVGDLQTGSTPSTRRPDFFGGEIKWLVSGDINKGEIYDCVGRITDEGLKNSNCKILPPNCVLIALNGQGKTRASVAMLRVPAACNQSLVAIIPFSQAIVDPEYLHLSLKYRYYEIRDITGQKQRRGLNMGLVSQLSIPLPPIKEQRRIVAKVENLMALCDKLEAQQKDQEQLRERARAAVIHALSDARSSYRLSTAWKRLEETMSLLFREPSDVDTLRDLILDLAATGRLSEPRADDSRAEKVIEGAEILRLRHIATGETKRTKISRTDVKDTDISIPSHWVTASVERLFRFIDYRGKTPTKTTSGRVLITAKNVRPGRIEAHPPEYISETDFQEWMTRGWPQLGDLLITTEAPLGNVAQIQEEPRFALAQRVINLQPHAELNTKYFMYFMMSPSFQRLLRANATGTTAKGIKASKLKQIKLSVPPYEEQDRIVHRTESLLTFCDQLEEQLEKSRSLARQLAKAFTAMITGISVEDKEKMKTPKTELVSTLRTLESPGSREQAPLTTILIRSQGELSAKALWSSSGLRIDEFYQQLKSEMAQGWIVQPEIAYMKELETS